MENQLGPFFFDGQLRLRTTGTLVPIARVARIAFFAMQIGVNPASV
jgi:hypothetical protein